MSDSLYMQIADAVETRIIAETDLTSAQVVILKDSKERERKNVVDYPGIEIELLGERFQETGGTNVAELISYPLQLSYVDEDRGTGTQNQYSGFDDLLVSRETIVDLFLRRRLTVADSRTCVFDCIWEPLVLFDRRAWRSRNLWRSPIVLRFMARRFRV